MTASFGRDTSCTNELRPGQLVSGIRLVAEAIYRRLTTPRGMLRGGDEEADYGLDLLDIIGSVSSKADIAALPGKIQNELLKDERVLSVDVVTSVSTLGPVTSATISIEVTTGEGPFEMTLAVSDVTVELLRLTE